jgi:hypothetical protein
MTFEATSATGSTSTFYVKVTDFQAGQAECEISKRLKAYATDLGCPDVFVEYTAVPVWSHEDNCLGMALISPAMGLPVFHFLANKPRINSFTSKTLLKHFMNLLDALAALNIPKHTVVAFPPGSMTFIHGDPHERNFVVSDEGVITLIDYGWSTLYFAMDQQLMVIQPKRSSQKTDGARAVKSLLSVFLKLLVRIPMADDDPYDDFARWASAQTEAEPLQLQNILRNERRKRKLNL